MAWTEAHYDTCFDLMENLVKDLGFVNSEEEKTLGDLKLWKNHGTYRYCLLYSLIYLFFCVKWLDIGIKTHNR